LHASEAEMSLINADFETRSQIVWNKPIHIISRGHYHWKHECAWYSVRKGQTAEWSGDRAQNTVWDIDHRRSETGHGTQKPIDCMLRPIENNSAKGDAVYEPFSGSGTTIIAGEMSGRKVYAMEISPAYIDVAVQRWEAYAKSKAVLASTKKTFAQIAKQRKAAK